MSHFYFLEDRYALLAQPHNMCGVEGLLVRTPALNGLWEEQSFHASRDFKGQGGKFDIVVEYTRGHKANTSNHFSMRLNFDGVTGPLGIEMAVKHWPELAHLVKWHLSSEGVPMYYFENTLYQGALGQPELARRCAHWPDAPDQILLGAPVKLEAALAARLPALQEEFFTDLAATGLLLNS